MWSSRPHNLQSDIFRILHLNNVKNYCIFSFPLCGGGCRPQPVFLGVLFGHGGAAITRWWLSSSVCTSSWAAAGDVVGRPPQPCPREWRVTQRHLQLLGCSWWALFLISCICDLVDFVHAKHPPASRAGGDDSTVVRPGGHCVSWVHWFCGFSGSASLQSSSVLGKTPQACPPCFLFSLLFPGSYFSTNVHTSLQSPFTQLTQGGPLYHLATFLYATLRQNKVISPSLWQTLGSKPKGGTCFCLPLLPSLLGAAPPPRHICFWAACKPYIHCAADPLV